MTDPTLIYKGDGLEAGYTRTMGKLYAPDGVEWWFYRSFGDGFAYARGGKVRTAREARKQIDGLYVTSESAHRAWLRRPTHELVRGGELREIAR